MIGEERVVCKCKWYFYRQKSALHYSYTSQEFVNIDETFHIANEWSVVEINIVKCWNHSTNTIPGYS